MKRENRANLVFLVVILALLLPGGVILFKKKLQPGASRMFEAEAISGRVPYMAPLPAPPNAKWVVPPLTQAWVSDLVRSKAVGASAVSTTGLPTMTDDHRAQLVAVGRQGGGTDLYIVVWSGDAELQSAELGHGLGAGNLGPSETLAVPEAVRHELKNNGLIRSPSHVIWRAIHIPIDVQPLSEPINLLLRFGDGSKSTFVNLFTR